MDLFKEQRNPKNKEKHKKPGQSNLDTKIKAAGNRISDFKTEL